MYPLPATHEQLKLPGVLMQAALGSHGLVVHSLTSVQFMPSPVNPAGQVHVNPALDPTHDGGTTQRLRFSSQ